MPTESFIEWDVSPVIFSVGPLSVRWYGLLFALGFLIGFFIMRRIFSIEKKPEADLDRLLVYIVIGTVVGARLGHCLFYEPGYYLRNPIEILMVWKGGLASHGGAIGVLLAAYYYSKSRKNQPYLWLLDRIAVPTALAGAFIRLGNLFNSEIYGAPTDVPWAFVFTSVDSVARHPTQLYESLSYLLIFFLLFWIYERYKEQTPRGLLIGLFFVLVFTARFLIEFVKADQVAFEAGLPINMGQILSIPVIIAGIYLMYKSRNDGTRTRHQST